MAKVMSILREIEELKCLKHETIVSYLGAEIEETSQEGIIKFRIFQE